MKEIYFSPLRMREAMRVRMIKKGRRGEKLFRSGTGHGKGGPKTFAGLSSSLGTERSLGVS